MVPLTIPIVGLLFLYYLVLIIISLQVCWQINPLALYYRLFATRAKRGEVNLVPDFTLAVHHSILSDPSLVANDAKREEASRKVSYLN